MSGALLGRWSNIVNRVCSYKMTFKIRMIFNTFISAVICSFSILGGELDYPGNDDTFRNLISVGAFGSQYNYYLPYSNVLYGIPIMVLNRLLPDINWYYWVMICLSVFAISITCAILFDDLPFSFSIAGCVIVNILLSRDYYVAVQFTKVASLWFVCGVLVIITSLIKNHKIWMVGVLYTSLGIMCRDSCAKMLLPFALLFTVFVLSKRWHDKISREIIIKNGTKTLITLLVTISVLIISEHIFLINNKPWQSYWQFENANALVIDRGMHLDYSHNPKAYDELGTDDNDLNLYSKWQFGDIDFYGVEWLSQVKQIESQYNNRSIRLDKNVLVMPFYMIWDTVIGNGGTSRWLVLVAIGCDLLVLIFGRMVDKIYVIGNAIGVYGMYWYFSCINRFMWRVECGIFVAVMLLTLMYIKETTESNPNKQLSLENKYLKRISFLVFVTTAIALSVFCVSGIYNWRYVKEKSIVAHEADITGRLNTFLESKDNYYILTDFYVTNNPMNITKSRYENLYDNSSYVGNWTFPSPVMMQSLQNRGYSNPMRALLNDNVYLYATNYEIADMIRIHLQKVINSALDLSEVDDNLYKLRIEE